MRLAAFGLLSCGSLCFSQTPSVDNQQAIERYHSCVSTLASMSKSPAAAELRANLDRLLVGLTTDWGKMPLATALARMPAEYREHLVAATAACNAQLRKARTSLRGTQPVSDADLEPFARDISLKLDDCRIFEMGRMAPVEIQVLKGGAPDAGWSVFYKWMPGAAAAAVTELPFPGPTPGATRNLPPGLYAVRAEKRDGRKSLQTGPSTVPVGGKDKIVFSLQAP